MNAPNSSESALTPHGADGVVVVDPDGRIVSLSARAEQLTGWSAREASGRPLATVLRLRSVEKGREVTPKAMRILDGGPAETEPAEVALVRPDGNRIRVLEGAGRLEGERPGAFVLLRDAADLQHEESRRLQMLKMEALQQLSGGIAHNVNNLLAGIMGYAELILHQRKRDTVVTYVGKIDATVERAADLMRQMLTFARLGPFRPEPVDLHGLLTEAAQHVRGELPAGVRVDTALELSDQRIDADPQQLRTALRHLLAHIGNRRGVSRIRLEVAPCTDAERLQRYDLDVRFAWVEVSVTDDGPGLSSADCARIFDPFFASVAAGRDPGLELACVHGIVSSHEGCIVCENHADGTDFHMFLPRNRLSTTTGIGRTTTARFESPTGFGTVFLVEDDERLCESLSGNLGHLGYRVRVAMDGEAGLEIFASEHKGIDVVLLDVHLPGISGEEVYARMREIDPDVACLVLTGHAVSDSLQRMLALGVHEVLHKPVSMKRLREAIDEVMDFG